MDIKKSNWLLPIGQKINWLLRTGYPPGTPLTYFNDGMSERSLWVWNFGKEWFFWLYERCWELFGSRRSRKKTRGILFGLRKKAWGIFLGILKKLIIFLGRQILKLWFFGYIIWTSVGPSRHWNLWVEPLEGTPIQPLLRVSSGNT